MMALGKSTGTKSKFLGLSALVSYYRRTQCDRNTGFPKPNDTRDVAETIVDEAVLLALGASVDDSNSMNGIIFTPTTAFDCLIDRLERNDNTGNPNSDVGLIVAALEALSIAMPPDAKKEIWPSRKLFVTRTEIQFSLSPTVTSSREQVTERWRI